MIDINDGYDILTSMARTMNARAKMSAKPAATQVSYQNIALSLTLR